MLDRLTDRYEDEDRDGADGGEKIEDAVDRVLYVGILLHLCPPGRYVGRKSLGEGLGVDLHDQLVAEGLQLLRQHGGLQGAQHLIQGNSQQGGGGQTQRQGGTADDPHAVGAVLGLGAAAGAHGHGPCGGPGKQDRQGVYEIHGQQGGDAVGQERDDGEGRQLALGQDRNEERALAHREDQTAEDSGGVDALGVEGQEYAQQDEKGQSTLGGAGHPPEMDHQQENGARRQKLGDPRGGDLG